MTHPLPVIVNKSGGAASALGDTLVSTLKDAFATTAVPADIIAVDGADIARTIKAHAGAPRIAVAGGDGTMATAAQDLAGTDTALAVMPLGTLNHLARDLGIPADVAGAAAIAAGGVTTAIDVGEVNGRVFVNNASIGLYSLMVRHRERVRRVRGWPKWLSTLPAAYAVLRRLREHRLIVDLGQGPRRIKTPLLFIGNNVYSMDLGQLGTRAGLSDGVLSVYAVAHTTRTALLWFAVRALAGRAERALDFEVIGTCTELTVRARSKGVALALDGEVQRMEFPLEFRVRPGALNVVVAAVAD